MARKDPYSDIDPDNVALQDTLELQGREEDEKMKAKVEQERQRLLKALRAKGVKVDGKESYQSLAYRMRHNGKAPKVPEDPKTSEKPEESEIPKEPEVPREPQLRNGKEFQEDEGGPQSKIASVPIRPRQSGQTRVSTVSKYSKTSPSDTGVRINDAPVEIGNTATRNHLTRAQRDTIAADAIEANERRKDAQSMALTNERRRYQQRVAENDRMDEWMKQRNERKDAERRAALQKRNDTNYNNRRLINKSDWDNLGREGSNKVDYSDPANAKAKADRDKTVSAIKDRLARMADRTLIRDGETANWEGGKMVVRDKDGNVVDTKGRTTTGVGNDGYKYANDFYANDPNRQRDLAGLTKLLERAERDGKLTDAQIEGVNKTLDRWEDSANDRKEMAVAREAARERERGLALRRKYGMEDKELYSDDDVKKYHEATQKEVQKSLLKKMSEDGAKAYNGGYGDTWLKLLDSGFDPRAVLKEALLDPKTLKSFTDQRRKIDDDINLSPERKAELRDQLQHRTIMGQAFKDARLSQTPANIDVIRTEGDKAIDKTFNEVTNVRGPEGQKASVTGTVGRANNQTGVASRANSQTGAATAGSGSNSDVIIPRSNVNEGKPGNGNNPGGPFQPTDNNPSSRPEPGSAGTNSGSAEASNENDVIPPRSVPPLDLPDSENIEPKNMVSELDAATRQAGVEPGEGLKKALVPEEKIKPRKREVKVKVR